jgi:hypothetical protein
VVSSFHMFWLKYYMHFSPFVCMLDVPLSVVSIITFILISYKILYYLQNMHTIWRTMTPLELPLFTIKWSQDPTLQNYIWKQKSSIKQSNLRACSFFTTGLGLANCCWPLPFLVLGPMELMTIFLCLIGSHATTFFHWTIQLQI